MDVVLFSAISTIIDTNNKNLIMLELRNIRSDYYIVPVGG
jgi:hypothetical protein